MCRSASGNCPGRRCPGNRGERKRAYQRARYASRQTEEEFNNSTSSTEQDGEIDDGQKDDDNQFQSGSVDFSSISLDNVYDIPVEHRKVLLEEVRQEVARRKQKAYRAFEDIIERDAVLKTEQLKEFEPKFLELNMEKRKKLFPHIIDEEGNLVTEFKKTNSSFFPTHGDNQSGQWYPNTNIEEDFFTEYEKSVSEVGESVYAASVLAHSIAEEGFDGEISFEQAIREDDNSQTIETITSSRVKMIESYDSLDILNNEKYSLDGKSFTERVASSDGSVSLDNVKSFLSDIYKNSGKSYDDMTEDEILSQSMKLLAKERANLLINRVDKGEMEYSKYKEITSDELSDGDIESLSNLLNSQPENLSEYLDAVLGSHKDKIDKMINTVSKNRAKKRAERFLETMRRETGAEFGETITPREKSSNVQSHDLANLEQASKVFPSSVIKEMEMRNHDLKYSAETGFYRGDSYVSKRAFFKEAHKVNVPIKGNKEFSLDIHTSSVSDLSMSFSRKTVSELDEMLESEKCDNGYYTQAMNDSFPEDTEENRKLAQASIDYQNDGDGYSYSRMTNNRGKPIKVKLDTFTDKLGVKRLRAVSHNKVKIGSKTKYMSVLVTDGSLNTTIHEASHGAETSPQIGFVCKAFRRRRVEGLEETVYHKSRTHGTEMTVTDGFFDKYVGKDYPSSKVHTEVFSMGMEHLFGESMAYAAQRKDGSQDEGIFTPVETLSFGGVNTENGTVTIKRTTINPVVEDKEHVNLLLGILSSHRSFNEIKKSFLGS